MDKNKIKIRQDFEKKQIAYYNDNYKVNYNYPRVLRNKLINREISKIRKFSIVLDMGCGPALLFDDLSEKCDEYYALDMVESNLDFIRERHVNNPKVKLIHSDIDSYVTKLKFDLIICSGSLEYTNWPVENLIKLSGFLKKDGILIASLPNKLSPYRIWSEYFYRYFSLIYNFFRRKKKYYYKRKLFSPDKLMKLLYCIDNSERNIRFFNVHIFPQPFDKIFSGLNIKINSLLENKSYIISKFFGTEFLLTIKNNTDNSSLI